MLPAGCYTVARVLRVRATRKSSRRCVDLRRPRRAGSRPRRLPGGHGGGRAAAGRCAAKEGAIRALSAVCQHRGEIIPCPEKGAAFRCPLHFWTYDLTGRLARRAAHGLGRGRAPPAREGAAARAVRLRTLARLHLRQPRRRPPPPLAPSLAKLDGLLGGLRGRRPRRRAAGAARTRCNPGTGSSTSRTSPTPIIRNSSIAARTISRRAFIAERRRALHRR